MYLDSESSLVAKIMTDAALENAMAKRGYFIERLTEIANEINRLIDLHGKTREEMEEVENFIRMWHQLAGTQPPPTLEQKVEVEGAEGARRIRPKNPPRDAVAHECVELIQEAGRPLSRRQLFEMLTDRGLEIRGKNPEMVLSTMLWRSKDLIQRLPEGGYWLAGEPTPLERSLEELMQ